MYLFHLEQTMGKKVKAEIGMLRWNVCFLLSVLATDKAYNNLL